MSIFKIVGTYIRTFTQVDNTTMFTTKSSYLYNIVLVIFKEFFSYVIFTEAVLKGKIVSIRYLKYQNIDHAQIVDHSSISYHSSPKYRQKCIFSEY